MIVGLSVNETLGAGACAANPGTLPLFLPVSPIPDLQTLLSSSA